MRPIVVLGPIRNIPFTALPFHLVIFSGRCMKHIASFDSLHQALMYAVIEFPDRKIYIPETTDPSSDDN